jgi:hypothetical protein
LPATAVTKKSQYLALGISQGTLAEIIGMTQSQVDFFMLKSEKLGFFHHSGGLHVNDSPHNVPLRD